MVFVLPRVKTIYSPLFNRFHNTLETPPALCEAAAALGLSKNTKLQQKPLKTLNYAKYRKFC